MNALEAVLIAAAKKDKSLAQLLGKAMASKSTPKRRTKKSKSVVSKSTPEQRAANQQAFAVAAIQAAAARGFENNIPNETLLTWNKWSERGFTVKKGEKAIRVKTANTRGTGLPLFHKDQVEPNGAEAA